MPVLTPNNLLAAIQAYVAAYDAEAVLIPRRVFGIEEDGFDADILRASGSIRAITFWISGFETEARPRVTAGQPIPGGRKVQRTWVVQFRLFREYATGSDISNVEMDFTAWAEGLSDVFASTPFLGLEDSQVAGHGDLQFPSPRLAIRPAGDLLIFQGSGELRVTSYKTL